MGDRTLIKALVLGLGQVTAKVLSLILLFRFSNDLGKDGMSMYVYAYIPFSLFADLSSFGLIPGTSKLVARLNAEKNDKKVNYLLKYGTIYCFIIGICYFLFMLFFSRQILSISLFGDLSNETFEIVRVNLLLASVSLFIIPLINFYKGFLQGHLVMYPSCAAIIVENVVKLSCYLLMIKYLLINNIIQLIFVIYFLGYFISLCILFLSIFKFYKLPKEKFSSIKVLLKTSIPFGFATMFFTIYQFIDSVTLPILMPESGYYTAYMYETIRLIFFPIVIAQAIGGALNPKMNYLFKENRKEEAKIIAVKCTNIVIYILIPLMIIMRLFSKEIYGVFYEQENGAEILYRIAILIIFFGIYKVLIGIAIGLPKYHYIVIATILSAISKCILNFILIKSFGYVGAIYATIIAISICILSAYYVLYREKIGLLINNLKSIFLSFLAVFVSLFFVVIYRTAFSLSSYPSYYSIILFSILLLGIYYMFIKSFDIIKLMSIH